MNTSTHNSKKYFVVSDVHSFMTELLHTLHKNEFDENNPNHILCVCGDLFDRGPDSVKLFKWVQNLGDRFIYIRGNHEDLLLECLDDIKTSQMNSFYSVHIRNGTIRTLEDITGMNLWEIITNPKMCVHKAEELVQFIESKSVNYCKLGETIFTHSTLPLNEDAQLLSNWNMSEEDARTELTTEEYTQWTKCWQQARWRNPFKHNLEYQLPCERIVFGHWHCSEGNMNKGVCNVAFPSYTDEDFKRAFEPYVTDTMIALDSCVGYSEKINCIVFDENGEILPQPSV